MARRSPSEFIDGQECAISSAVCHTFDPVSLLPGDTRRSSPRLAPSRRSTTLFLSSAGRLLVLLRLSRDGPQMYQTINYRLLGICGPRINLPVFMSAPGEKERARSTARHPRGREPAGGRDGGARRKHRFQIKSAYTVGEGGISMASGTGIVKGNVIGPSRFALYFNPVDRAVGKRVFG